MMDNKLFTFFELVWGYIDRGTFYREPFRWLYGTVSVLNLLFPPYIIYTVTDSGVFEFLSGGDIVACVLVFLLLIFLGIMSFSLWMDRKKKMKDILLDNSDFVAIPMVSHFIQTLGEWLGFYFGVGGCVISLFFVVFGLGDSLGQLFGILPLGTGLSMVVIYPIVGYLIVVSGRLIAELYRALASIANNTKRTNPAKGQEDTPADEAPVDTED